MARLVYTLLWWLALPLIPLRLAWRARREPGYAHAVGERFGRYRARARPPGEVLWIHAVSVGETRAAAPLVERLQREHPDAVLLLTCMTAAGRETGRSLYGGRVVQAWLPYDVPFAVRAFLDRWRPRAGLLMETELWPNLVHACRRRGVPLFLVNARMSPRSAAGYARVAPLARPMLAALSGIAAQTAGDAERLAALGARDVTVTGNLKFDLALPEAMRALGAALRERFGRARRVWLCASTREGEEALLLDALARRALPDDVLLVLVPRHPQRFDEVASLLRARGLAAVRRSVEAPVGAAVRVVLGDSMGEMLAYCAAADVAFVGGSLLPLGGQNLIEPIALGVPTLVGPHTFNFAEATERAIEAGAARRVADADALVAAAASLLADAEARERMRAAALAFHAQHRGATQRLWTWLAPRLAERAARDAAAVSPTAGG
ncbi:MAG: 3-deoxy-D-manno-octulosonic acid transferase [Betaproteobacteria bacterium]|nr:MAG: 3-deoxy-D-manno-octulosonic acid transferase [Betaproteobacteria bacterium]